MTDVLLLHHAQGRTGGIVAIAEHLRADGHTVHVPDLFDGRTFDALDDGLAFAREKGFDRIREEGVAAADGLPEALAVIGVSMGVMAAQQLAQTRPGVVAAVLIASCLPVDEFGKWPAGVPVQVHGAEGDPVFMQEGDVEAARELVAAAADDDELYLYPGSGHLFVDATLADSDPEAAETVVARISGLLRRSA